MASINPLLSLTPDPIQLGRERVKALGIGGFLVHASAVIIPDLLLERAASWIIYRGLFQYPAQGSVALSILSTLKPAATAGSEDGMDWAKPNGVQSSVLTNRNRRKFIG